MKIAIAITVYGNITASIKGLSFPLFIYNVKEQIRNYF